MALSDEWTEWHLTPRGWGRGTAKTDFGKQADTMARPPDAVLTSCYRVQQSSIYSPEERGSSEQWRSTDEAQISALLVKFGAAPERL